jgi:prepilin-type N-terminal cleavage/methylation domain-containing protein
MRRARSRPTRRGAQAGFSMIEVLAAMVIFSSSAVVLFSWIGQTADRLARLNHEQTVLFAELAALEYLRGLNPMATPSGATQLADVAMTWKAQPVGAEAPALTLSGAPGLYVVQLYEVQLEVRPPGVEPGRRTLMLAGWRQTREARDENPFVTTPK